MPPKKQKQTQQTSNDNNDISDVSAVKNLEQTDEKEEVVLEDHRKSQLQKPGSKQTDNTRASTRNGARRKSRVNYADNSSSEDEKDDDELNDEDFAGIFSKSVDLQGSRQKEEIKAVTKKVPMKQTNRKVLKSNEGGDLKQEAKKQTAAQAARNKSKPVSHKADDSDESDGQDVGSDSEEESDGFDDSSDQESDDSDEEEKKGPSNPKSAKSKKNDNEEEEVKASKKRTRDGKPKKPQPSGKDAKKPGTSALGGGGKEKDDGGKKMMTDKEAQTAIHQYMIKQNRPYSVQNVIDNLHGRVKKAQAQKFLDELSDKKILTCKEFGKAKVYLANQDNFPTTSNDELLKLDLEIKGHKDKLQQQQLRLKEVQAQLRDIQITPSNDSLEAEIAKYKQLVRIISFIQIQLKNIDIGGRIEKYEAGNVRMISEEEVNEAKQAMLKYGNEWKKRKRACMDIVDTICEGAEMGRKEFFNKVSLELDEDFKININDVLNC
eukprot:403356227